MSEDDDWYDDDWDDDLDDVDDVDEVIPCPECHAELHAEADACYACGYWLTDADREAAWAAGSASQRIQTIGWWLIGIAAVGIAMLWVL